MESLNREQRNVLLDYYFECASETEAEQAKSLLNIHSGATEFYEKLHHSLSALEHLDSEAQDCCPEHLAAKTLEKLHAHHSQSSEEKLDGLLAVESRKVVTQRPSFWRSILEVSAAAAVILIVSGIFIPVTYRMRTQAWQTACNANLSRIARGITSYAGDNEGKLPAVATMAGAPWWKVGSTTEENQSNTRHLWLLIQGDYLRPKLFVCPGRAQGKATQLDRSLVGRYRDFPDRRYITYSFKLISEPDRAAWPQGRVPLMSDANPVFEGCGRNADYHSRREFEPIKLCEKLMRANSRNHRRRGQNVMFSDGAIEFLKQRMVNGTDDIFTVKDLNVYRGVESPSGEKDIFLVP